MLIEIRDLLVEFFNGGPRNASEIQLDLEVFVECREVNYALDIVSEFSEIDRGELRYYIDYLQNRIESRMIFDDDDNDDLY